MSVVINIVLSAARWSRDRQFSYILLMTFSGKLFPLIFRPHILEVERSVSSGTLRCEQSHHEEVPGWRARYKMGFAGGVIKTAPRDGWGSGGSGGSFLPSLEQDQGGFSSFVTFFFFPFPDFLARRVLSAEDTQPPRTLPKAFQVQPPQTDRWTHTAPCASQG